MPPKALPYLLPMVLEHTVVVSEVVLVTMCAGTVKRCIGSMKG